MNGRGTRKVLAVNQNKRLILKLGFPPVEELEQYVFRMQT